MIHDRLDKIMHSQITGREWMHISLFLNQLTSEANNEPYMTVNKVTGRKEVAPDTEIGKKD